ncbi:MAG: SIR2 family protein [Planctomycetes bacterium]|nr:SIR2 family protein [Planctomycetota bacterium]
MSIDWKESDFVFLLKQLRQGRAILFLGAGFSFDARNEAGDSPPLGWRLAKILAEEAGFEYQSEPLPVVYEAAQKQLGTASLWSLLRRLYDIRSYAEWYKIVQAVTWYRIYTMNIDNLVQRLYSTSSTQRLRTIINPAPIEERDGLYRELQCIHLHGFVETPDKGLSFTLPDFGHLTAKPNPWYQSLIDDLYHRSVIFIGTALEETTFQHYLQIRDPKDRATQEFRPKSYLINPSIGRIRAGALKERNIVAVECTGEQFFTSLQSAIEPRELTLRSVRSNVFPSAIFREDKAVLDENINRYFDLIRSDALPFIQIGTT